MTDRQERRPLFRLGGIYATPGALNNVEKYGVNIPEMLSRHVCGDWGELDEFDKKENDLAVGRRLRILSAYGEGDARLWVITEADRSMTTVLRPDEY